MEHFYRIKNNCARVDDNEKTIFFSSRIARALKGIDYSITCIFCNTKTGKIVRQLDFDTKNIMLIDFDHTSKHYKEKNETATPINPIWFKSSGDTYDIVLGRWVDNSDYDDSSANIVFKSKADKAKFMIKLKSEYQ